MASNSERSFGARLRKLQDAVEYIKGWTNYLPPRPTETVAQLQALITKVIAANDAETNKQAQYNNAVKAREAHYIKHPDSLNKLLSPIGAAVIAKFTKKSIEYNQVAAIVTQMRNTRLTKLPADPTTDTAVQSISQSERSYGSMTQYFTDLVTTLAAQTGYAPSNPKITVAALKAKLAAATAANNLVASSLQAVQSSRRSRTDLYNDIAERSAQIKAYTKSQYLLDSPEYKSLTRLGL